jgi:hypothetical protein
MLSAWCDDELSAILLIRILSYIDGGPQCDREIRGCDSRSLRALGCTDLALRHFVRAYVAMDLMKPIVQGKVLMIDAGSSVDMRFWDASNERLYISGVPITPAGKTDVCIDLSACNSPPLYIAKTPGGKGYGLYSCVYLPKGSIIGAYCGEVIRSDECSKRQRDVYDPTVDALYILYQ